MAAFEFLIRQCLAEKEERSKQQVAPIARALPGGGSLMITPQALSVRFGDDSGIERVNGRVVFDRERINSVAYPPCTVERGRSGPVFYRAGVP